MMGIMIEFDLDGIRQGMLDLDGFVKKLNLIAACLTNGEPCG